MRRLNKLFRFVLLFCFAFSFTFCGNDDNEEPIPEVKGLIPGLGSVPGELTGQPFSLPVGILLNGVIQGRYDSYTSTVIVSSQSVQSDKPKAEANINAVVGSGYNVVVYIPLRNTTANDIEVVFPAGLIIVANSTNFQNGVLLKKVSVTVPANTAYRVILLTYSGNEELSASSPSVNYSWGVVSDAPLLIDLCNKLADKKINYEEFEQGDAVYNTQSKELQNILWAITDDTGTYKEQIEWIDALPESVK